MKNLHTFNYPETVVYDVIAELVLANAQPYVEKELSIEDLKGLVYEYDTISKKGTKKMKVLVNDVVKNNKIVYTVSKEGLETYVVTFDVEALDDGESELEYGYELSTDKVSLKTNHKLLGFLVSRKQKRKFEEMCQYLETKCAQKMEEK